MRYTPSNNDLDTSKKILKVNHAGEFGAINIYRAQILVSKFLRRDYTALLAEFLTDEERHLEIFWTEIQRRNGIKCKSYWLCGIGGYFMGFISALLGKRGVMACTWAVESVVTEHLENQLSYLQSVGDTTAFEAVKAIIEDEEHHRDLASADSGMNVLYSPFRTVIRLFTEGVIRFGMR